MVLAVLRSRKFKKNILWGLLILILPAFVLWGIGSVTSKPQVLGQINGKKISTEDFETARQGIRAQVILSYFGDNAAMNNILANRPLLNYMTWERLLYLEAAKKDRITVKNDDVRAFLSSHPLFMKNGAFDRTAYDYLLKNAFSMDARKFEELVRENLTIKTYRQKLLQNVSVSEEEALTIYEKTNSKVVLSYIVFPTESFYAASAPEETEVLLFYEENKDEMYSPPKVDVAYIEAGFTDAASRASAEKTMVDVYEEVSADPDEMERIAGRNNLKYGRTGPFSREELPRDTTFSQEFQDAAFSLPPGEVSVPFASSGEKGGVYILFKKADIAPKPLSFDEAKPRITKFLSNAKALGMAEERASKIYESLVSESTDMRKAAEQAGLQIMTTKEITYKDYIENAGPGGETVFAALSAGVGKYLEPVLTEKGVLIARVEKIVPADRNVFDGDKENITKGILVRKQMATLDEWLAARSRDIKLNRPLEEM